MFLLHRTSALTPKGSTERSISASKLHGLSERDHNGRRSACFTGREGHGIIRKDDFTACQAHERVAAGIQYYCCINENVHNLVRMQFLVQHDNQSTPRSALGDYWVNREAAIRVLCTRAPSSRSSRVRA